jgi:alkanesulfonate monooxygenase SsuD/methylene tetrahydromethanopterin reductase-like flavin-dependent oxidoreductase (luciferase family)
MMRITAKHADIWNTRSPIDEAERKSRLLDAKCAEIGRDPGEIQRSVWPGPSYLTSADDFAEYVATFTNAGFTDFLFSWPRDDAEQEVLQHVAADVIPRLRGA